MEQKNILKKDIIEYMKRLCENGLTTVLGGNISCRVNGGMLLTPSSIDKNHLKDSDIIEMDLNGNKIEGIHEPSMEHRIHSSIYKTRLDIGAIIHSHSFYSLLFAIIDKEINVKITAESAKNIGVIGVANYASMGTEQLAESVSQKIKKHNVVLARADL
jgi:L-fuculose-phosphate aldolase